jgi:hypothetical protein
MLTKAQLDEIHRALDAATLALGDLVDARVTGNERAAEVAVGQMSTELGACKFALRVLYADE